jgi:hypothetical protein
MIKDVSGQGVGQPAIAGFNIGPNDVSYLPFIPRAVYVGGQGNLAVMMFDGSIIMLAGVVAGTLLPIRVLKVFATGTTASNLVGLY